MDADELLRQISIPSPCPADWDAMAGDNLTRHCESCGKSVVNLSAMSKEDAALLVDHEEDLCARITRRKNGSVVTARHGQFTIRKLMGIIAWIAAMLGLLRFLGSATTITSGRVCRVPPAPTTPPGGSASIDEPPDEESPEEPE
jgi:hypothetical protein